MHYSRDTSSDCSSASWLNSDQFCITVNKARENTYCVRPTPNACTNNIVSAEQVTPEANFADDLDADSLDLVELVMALEEEFSVTVEEEELEGIDTIQAAFELITSKL